MEFIKTGIVGLDEILNGEIQTGSSIIVEGPSGSGKTILGFQFVFGSKDPSIILSLNEKEDSLLDYASKFKWKNINNNIIVIEEKNAKNIFLARKNNLFENIANKRNIKRVVIDDVDRLIETSENTDRLIGDFNVFLKNLKAKGITCVILKKEATLNSLNYLTDIVIKLSTNLDIQKRRLTILKVKNKEFAEGDHLLNITNEGITVYPNIKYLEKVLTGAKIKRDTSRVGTGVEELDKIFGGGIFKGDISLLAGPSGIGKTILSMRYINEGLMSNEKCLYISFDADQIKMDNLAKLANVDIIGNIKKGYLKTCQLSSGLHEEEILNGIYESLKENNIQRIVIDGIDILKGRYTKYSDILRVLKMMFLGKNLLLVLNISNKADKFIEEEDTFKIADNIIMLKYTEMQNVLKRIIYITKSRNPVFDRSFRELIILNEGVSIGERIEGYQNILGDSAQKKQIKLIALKDPLIERIVNDFKKDKPDVDIEISDDEKLNYSVNQMKSMMINNKNMSIIPLNSGIIQLYAKEKMLLELDSIFSDDQIQEYFPAALEECSRDQHIYAVPEDVKCEVIFYRKDLLSKYGFLQPKTWEELVEQAKYIRLKENNKDLAGMDWAKNIVYRYLDFFYANGQDIYKKNGKLNIAEKEAIDTLQFMHDLIYKEKIVAKDVLVTDLNEKSKRFCEGNIIFFLCSTIYRIPYFIRESKYEMGVMPLPIGKYGKERVSIISDAYGYVISKWSDYPKTSMEFLKYFTSLENQKRLELESECVTFPGRRTICYDKDILNIKPYYKKALDLLENVRIKHIKTIPLIDRISVVLSKYLTSALENKTSAENSLGMAYEELQGLEKKPVHVSIANGVINYLHENMHRNLNLNEIAANFNISAEHLARLFKKETQKTVFDYLNDLRIERSKMLLKDLNLNINEVSVKCGFNDSNYFSKAFRKYEDISPSEYRNKVV